MIWWQVAAMPAKVFITMISQISTHTKIPHSNWTSSPVSEYSSNTYMEIVMKKMQASLKISRKISYH